MAHGENRNARAAKDLAKSIRIPGADPATMQKRFPIACTCRWSYPFPHLHSLEDRQGAVRRWNRESTYKLPIPKD